MSQFAENDQSASVEPARSSSELPAQEDTHAEAPGLQASPARAQSKGLSYSSFKAAWPETSGESSVHFSRLTSKDPTQSAADTLPLPRPDLSIPHRRGRDTTLMAAILAILITVSGVLLGATTYNGHSTLNSSTGTTVTAESSTFPFSTRSPWLSDSLADASQDSTFGWTGGEQCVFAGGAYHVLADSARMTSCLATAVSIGDFSLQVQMTIADNGSGGLIFHKAPQANNYYVLSISSVGKINLLSVENGVSQVLVYLDLSKVASVFRAGPQQTNTIAVTDRRGWIAVSINQAQILTFSSETYTGGQFGLIASAETGSTDVAYSNLKIWKL